MAAESKPITTNTNPSLNKKRKQRYLPHNRSVKKGSYPLRPGVQGFFITCDGGKERQASREAINVIDSFYEDLVQGNDSGGNCTLPNKTLNKKTKFTYSDSSSSDDEDKEFSEESEKEEEVKKDGEVRKEEKQLDNHRNGDANRSPANETSDPSEGNKMAHEIQSKKRIDDSEVHAKNDEDCENGAEEPPSKKHCLETDASKSGNVSVKKVEKSIDQLIDAEIKELGDRNKRRFSSLDSGCNGVAFVQLRRADGDLSPKEIVQHMMTSAASTRKHMSRFILRVLPVEVACYASEEDITRAIKPIIAEYFPLDETPVKFAVLYDARANTGVERMKIINAVAKSVPVPHKVDLNHPDKTIVVQIVKTVCLIGVVEKYKELAKYNLRQLTSPK